MKKLSFIFGLCTFLFLSCENNSNTETKKNADTTGNPLLQTFNTPFEVPPFDLIKPEHFLPAFVNQVQGALPFL